LWWRLGLGRACQTEVGWRAPARDAIRRRTADARPALASTARKQVAPVAALLITHGPQSRVGALIPCGALTMSDAFTTIVTGLDAPLIVVTAAMGEERAGCLVGFHTQSSIAPQRYSIWLSKANHTYRVACQSLHLGIHFLSDGDLTLAERFGTLTGDTTDKFAGVRTETSRGVPVLLDCPNRIVVRRIALLDEGGDHVCIVTEPIQAHSARSLTPLRLAQAVHLEPGHSNDERHRPPTERAAPPARGD
jgi:flavin reductase (DIM6/NTAB) family NADH-FMN oxidoreductase RutF